MGDSLTNLGFFVIKNRRPQNLMKKQDLGKSQALETPICTSYHS